MPHTGPLGVDTVVLGAQAGAAAVAAGPPAANSDGAAKAARAAPVVADRGDDDAVAIAAPGPAVTKTTPSPNIHARLRRSNTAKRLIKPSPARNRPTPPAVRESRHRGGAGPRPPTV